MTEDLTKEKTATTSPGKSEVLAEGFENPLTGEWITEWDDIVRQNHDARVLRGMLSQFITQTARYVAERMPKAKRTEAIFLKDGTVASIEHPRTAFDRDALRAIWEDERHNPYLRRFIKISSLDVCWGDYKRVRDATSFDEDFCRIRSKLRDAEREPTATPAIKMAVVRGEGDE